MKLDAQVAAIVAKGFSERQARFLVLVMRHAGVCVMRQYATFADIVFGDKTRAFFAKLVRLGCASSFDTSKGRGRLFHVHGRELYDAIGKPHSRFRRPPPVAHAIARCMLLDAILAHSDVVWLEGSDEKVVHLTTLAGIPVDDLPHSMVGIGARRRLQHFPDRLPSASIPRGASSSSTCRSAEIVNRSPTSSNGIRPCWLTCLRGPSVWPSRTTRRIPLRGGWTPFESTLRRRCAQRIAPSFGGTSSASRTGIARS